MYKFIGQAKKNVITFYKTNMNIEKQQQLIDVCFSEFYF